VDLWRLRRLGRLAALLLAGAATAGCRRAPPAVPQAIALDASAALPAVPPPRPDGRLPPEVTPLGYALDLVIDPATPRFSGGARIKVRIATPVRALVLHAKGLAVRRATVKTRQGQLTAVATLRKAAGSKAEPEELVLALDRAVGPGEAELDLAYDGPFGNKMRGLYRTQDRGAWYAFTQFEPTDARRAFPCFDEPGFKTPFDVAITVPQDLVAFANMKERRRQPQAGGGQVRFEFETSPPLPTYLVALAVGTFDVVAGAAHDLAVRILATKGKGPLAGAALSATLGLLGPLSRYFQRPYPYGKLDLVAVPAFGSGAMENAGLLTFREERLLLDAGASLGSRLASATVVAHELAHQWFGDLVTMAWWDDLWLNEAFATWMADKAVDEWRPATRARLQANAGKARVMSEDSLSTARRIRNPVGSTSAALEAFDGVTYVKGRAVLAMTEAWLGEDTFREGIRLYLDRHAWRSATAADLYAALAEASGGRPVARVMDAFTTQTGFPVVDATLECGDGPGGQPPAVRLSQREYRTLDRKAEPSDKLWQIPVCLAFPAAARPARAGAKLVRQCALMDAREARVELEGAVGCPAFVYANAGEDGYYAVQLGGERLAPLAGALDRLPEPERFGVVSNAFAAVRSGELPASSFLELATKLGHERSRLVWSETIDALWAIDRALVADDARPAFARLVRGLAAPTVRRLGWRQGRNESDDDHFLRESVLHLAGDLGEDEGVLAQADHLARQWLAASARAPAPPTSPNGEGGVNAVSNDLARVALPLAAKHGDGALWQQMAGLLQNPATPEVRLLALSGLIAFEDRDLVGRTLALLLDGTIKPQDFRYVFPAMALRRASRDAALAWIQAHFDEIAPQIPPAMVGRVIASLAGLCEAERVRASAAFVGAHTAQMEGVGKDLRQSVESALRCSALADAQREATSDWLKSIRR